MPEQQPNIHYNQEEAGQTFQMVNTISKPRGFPPLGYDLGMLCAVFGLVCLSREGGSDYHAQRVIPGPSGMIPGSARLMPT
jgi:hypothetical protein